MEQCGKYTPLSCEHDQDVSDRRISYAALRDGFFKVLPYLALFSAVMNALLLEGLRGCRPTNQIPEHGQVLYCEQIVQPSEKATDQSSSCDGRAAAPERCVQGHVQLELVCLFWASN